jgi:hypothetical protein
MLLSGIAPNGSKSSISASELPLPADDLRVSEGSPYVDMGVR